MSISLYSKKIRNFIRKFSDFNCVCFRIKLAYTLEFEIFNKNGLYLMWPFENGRICRSNRVLNGDAGIWLNHFLDIFNPSKIDSLNIRVTDGVCDEQSIQILQESLKNIRISDLSIVSKIATHHITRLLTAHNQVFNTTEISVRRPGLFRKHQRMFLAIDVPLNELLLTCSSSIRITESRLTNKDINLFLKPSNPYP